MNTDDLKKRTKQFAIDVIRLCLAMPSSRTADILARQMIRAATSVAANYRAACRAKSRADFIAKMGTVEEEADESAFWLELATDTGLVASAEAARLRTEAGELTAIAVSSIRTARLRSRNPHSAFRTPQF